MAGNIDADHAHVVRIQGQGKPGAHAYFQNPLPRTALHAVDYRPPAGLKYRSEANIVKACVTPVGLFYRSNIQGCPPGSGRIQRVARAYCPVRSAFSLPRLHLPCLILVTDAVTRAQPQVMHCLLYTSDAADD